jgi:hypothetical protein
MPGSPEAYSAVPEPVQIGCHMPSSDAHPISLALQGGGSLGSFTWGVLDRLLDRPELRIEAVSGASGGAMNAALLAQGLATGGPAEAKRLLEAFWCRVAITPRVPRWCGCPAARSVEHPHGPCGRRDAAHRPGVVPRPGQSPRSEPGACGSGRIARPVGVREGGRAHARRLDDPRPHWRSPPFSRHRGHNAGAFSPQRVSRSSFQRSRSRASPTGTAATRATRQCGH